jgi:hypothetical protein
MLQAWPGVCGYSIGNVAGFLRVSNGNKLGEFAGSGLPLDLQYDLAATAGTRWWAAARASFVEALPSGRICRPTASAA